MAQLWGGRFTKKTDQMVYDFNASIRFDQRLLPQDIQGSLAHVKMLTAQGILTETEGKQITEALEQILADVRNGSLAITEEYEDVHSFVEAVLTERIGEAGKKLHTGRSRNDQVATDMKLYVREEIDTLDSLLYTLLQTLEQIIEANMQTLRQRTISAPISKCSAATESGWPISGKE